MAEIAFHNPTYLWYLISVPLLIFSHFYFLRYAKYRGLKFANFEALKRVSGKKILTKNYFQLVFRIIILVCLVLAASGPIFWYKGETNVNDFVIALDVSASMTAQDIAPTRIEAAKKAGIVFIDELKNSNIKTRIGLLVFSGSTYIEELVTKDVDEVKLTLEEIEVRREGGTDIAGAVVAGTNMLVGSERGKALILISDGSATVSVVEDSALKNAVKYAQAQRVLVHTLGIGTETGPLGYLPEFYNASAVFNEGALMDLANATSGSYHKINTVSDLNKAYKEIGNASTEAMVSIDFSYSLLLISLFLIFVEWGLLGIKFRRIP